MHIWNSANKAVTPKLKKEYFTLQYPGIQSYFNNQNLYENTKFPSFVSIEASIKPIVKIH